MKPTGYLEVIPTRIHGIPAKLGVVDFSCVKGNPHTWDSDWDYYGYSEIEIEVLDRKGYPAPWLEKKLSDKDWDNLEQEASNFMEKIDD